MRQYFVLKILIFKSKEERGPGNYILLCLCLSIHTNLQNKAFFRHEKCCFWINENTLTLQSILDFPNVSLINCTRLIEIVKRIEGRKRISQPMFQKNICWFCREHRSVRNFHSCWYLVRRSRERQELELCTRLFVPLLFAARSHETKCLPW
jgi:hypothetical protein